MKERYENAEMDVVIFSAEDVINTSDAYTTIDHHFNPNCENDGPAGDAFL